MAEIGLNRRHFGAGLAAALAMPKAGLAQGAGVSGSGRDRVTFGTNWLAQGEHGGFYQALADGTYARHGLDVTIVPGGPGINNRLMMSTGKLDFYMGGNLIQPFSVVERVIPTKIVAAIFQKDPQIFMTHPGQGLDTWEAFKRAKTIFVSKDALASFYRWMIAEHGFTEAQTKPYGFNPAPFLADKASAQQGYLTSEPFSIEKAGGFRPNVFLLADHGFDTYSTTIETQISTIETRADLVQRFVDASILGWYTYLYGDNAAANALIMRDNPDITPERLAFSLAKMKEYGIVDSGEAAGSGIGAMSEARVKSFFERMVRSEVTPSSVDWRRSFTLQFVNKGVGMNLRPKP